MPKRLIRAFRRVFPRLTDDQIDLMLKIKYPCC